MTTDRVSFSLHGIVHAASADERNDKGGSVDSRRYWRLSNGEVARKKPWIGDATCYIVTTGNQGGRIELYFECSVMVPGSSWSATAAGRAVFQVAQADISTLLQKMRRLETDHRERPSQVFYDAFQVALATAVERITEKDLCSGAGLTAGSVLQSEVSGLIYAEWGISVSLSYEIQHLNQLHHQELRIETRVRLKDYVEEFAAVALVELDGKAISVLRAVASMTHQTEMEARFSETIRLVYAEVTLETLRDPFARAKWIPQLESALNDLATQQFGRKARLVRASEDLPEPPGKPDEQVTVQLIGCTIVGEPEPVDIVITVKLENKSMTQLLRAMASRPGRRFNSEFELSVRQAASPIVARWTGKDLSAEARSRIEQGLSAEVDDKARGFGYAVVACLINTSLDAEAPERKYTVALVSRSFSTAVSDVTVQVRASAELTFAPGARERKPIKKLLSPYVEEVRVLLETNLQGLQPSHIYQYWTIPTPNGAPLKEDLIRKIEDVFKNVTEHISVMVDLEGHAEALRTRTEVLKSELDVKGIRLTPENVPGEIAVDVHAFVRNLTERAWGDIAESNRLGQAWEPLERLKSDLVRLMQENFRNAMDVAPSSPVSRRSVIEDLSQGLSKAVQERYYIVIEPGIVAYSSREVVAFFRHEAEERQRDVEDFFELIRALKEAHKQQQLKRIEALTFSEKGHPETRRLEESIKALEDEINDKRRKVAGLQEDFANAMYFVNLLSVPSDNSDKGAARMSAHPQPQIEPGSGTPEEEAAHKSDAASA